MRAALFHFIDLAACFERQLANETSDFKVGLRLPLDAPGDEDAQKREPTGSSEPSEESPCLILIRRNPEDSEADRLLKKVAALLRKHESRRAKEGFSAFTMQMVEMVRSRYQRLLDDEGFTLVDLESALVEGFESLGLTLSEGALDELVMPLLEIREKGGAKQAAVEAIAALVNRTPRALYYSQKRSPSPLPMTAYGVRMGGTGMLRYFLELFSLPEDVVLAAQEAWTQSLREPDSAQGPAGWRERPTDSSRNGSGGTGSRPLRKRRSPAR